MRLFLITKRSWVSALLIVSAIYALFTGNFTGVGSCILVAILLILPELLYFMRPAASLWAKWSEVHTSQEQMKRYDRALDGDLTPLWTDSNAKCACFVGGQGGKYRTLLTKCSCPDFKKRNAPCKHMYYLANSCSLIGK